MNPLVSVIMPVYNGEKYLAGALDTVAAQDYAPLEVIVVDDGSTDATAQIAKAQPEVSYLYQANQGCGIAKNTGLTAAHGAFVAFLDADDLWLPGKVTAQMDYLLAHPGIEFVLCKMEAFLEPGSDWPATFSEAYYRQQPAAYVPSALLARQEAFVRVGLFNADYRISNDSDWFFRARDAGVPMAVLPQTLLRRRIHPGNISQHSQDVSAELLRLVRASISRKRRAVE